MVEHAETQIQDNNNIGNGFRWCELQRGIAISLLGVEFHFPRVSFYCSR